MLDETPAIPEAPAPAEMPGPVEAPVVEVLPRQPTSIFWLCFAICAAATVAPLWAVDFLPATDLPQHAAQIALWQRLDAGIGGETYRLNWFTPYLFGYSLVRLVSFFTSIETALRVVLSAYVIALPLGMFAWLRALRRPWELSLLALPAAYGFSFQWGFFNYTCALPVALFFLAYGERHLQRPTRRTTIGIALFSSALFFAHVLILAASGVILAGRALLQRPLRQAVLRLLPAATGGLFVIPWLYLVRANNSNARSGSTGWELGLQRFLDLPSLMYGLEGDRNARYLGLAILAWALVSVVFAFVQRNPARLLAPGVALLLYAFIPSYAMDTFFLAPRFAIVFLLVLIPALALPVSLPGRRIALALLVVGIGLWSASIFQRFRGFDQEARGLNEVLAEAAPEKALLGLMYEQGSAHFGGRPFLHYPAWYQARKGGKIGFSFAQFFPELVRFQHDKKPELTPGLEWDPRRFDWKRDGWYDYVLVRSAKADHRVLQTGKNRHRARLVKQSGSWWLYEIDNDRQDGTLLRDRPRLQRGGGIAPPLRAPEVDALQVRPGVGDRLRR